MMHLIIDRLEYYFKSRKEVNTVVKFWSKVNVAEVEATPAVIFKPIARTDKQLAEDKKTYPSYDIIIRVIAASIVSSWDAFCAASDLTDRLVALLRCNSKLFDRRNVFKDTRRYFLSTSDVVGVSYESDSVAPDKGRAGSFQHEMKIFLRCYQAHGVEGLQGKAPTCHPPADYDMTNKYVDWETGDIINATTGDTVDNITSWGCQPITPEEAEEFLGWYMSEDQTIGQEPISRGNIFLRVFTDGVLEAQFNIDLERTVLPT